MVGLPRRGGPVPQMRDGTNYPRLANYTATWRPPDADGAARHPYPKSEMTSGNRHNQLADLRHPSQAIEHVGASSPRLLR